MARLAGHERGARMALAMIARLERYADCYSDAYVGSAEALVAAGIVPRGCFPGQPGMRKVVVSIHADGTIAGGAPTSPSGNAGTPGSRRIRRKSKTEFQVEVARSGADGGRRRDAWLAERGEWERKMNRLPKPGPLQPRAQAERAPPRATPSRRDVEPRSREGVAAARADVAFQGMLSRLLDQRSGWAT